MAAAKPKPLSASGRQALAWLREAGLVRTGAREDGLLALCDAGRLLGGLTVSLRATPDELVGPLTHALGGAAVDLRVLDVREGAPLRLVLLLRGAEVEWSVEGVQALAEHLNDAFRDEVTAKVLAVLGEHEEALQLWVLPRLEVAELLEEPWFVPLNRAQLERLFAPPEGWG
jgi:predicted component of type VI protein secretion system